jgi:hypothetical protein
MNTIFRGSRPHYDRLLAHSIAPANPELRRECFLANIVDLVSFYLQQKPDNSVKLLVTYNDSREGEPSGCSPPGILRARISKLSSAFEYRFATYAFGSAGKFNTIEDVEMDLSVFLSSSIIRRADRINAKIFEREPLGVMAVLEGDLSKVAGSGRLGFFRYLSDDPTLSEV